MSSVWNWLKGGQTKTINREEHGEIVSYCCSDICKYDRQICKCIDCAEKHKGHTLMDYKNFKQVYSNAIQEINCRKRIEDRIRQYNQTLIQYFQQILQMETVKMLEQIDKKIFGKNFLQMYKRHLTGKTFYSFLPQFKTTLGEDVNNLIQKAVQQKKSNIPQQLKQLMITNRILVQQYLIGNIPKIRNDPNQSKIDKIKSIMPFPCQLTRKFQASKHRFQTYNLHKLGIRGPIVLVAESYKGKIFGGFSPKMFPKEQYYQQDNRCRSFLFSLDHRVRLPLKQQYKKFAIKGGNNLWFGRGDLVIADQCNKANISWAQIGRAYELPPGISGDVDEWLAGSMYFRIIQFEIYEVESVSLLGK